MMNFQKWLSLNEALSLKGSYKGTIFQRIVAAKYVLLPAFQPEAIDGYRDLMKKIQRQNQFLQSKFQFKPGMDDPYDSMKQMTKDISAQKAAGIKKPTFRVYAEPPKGSDISVLNPESDLPGSEGHPLLSNDQNVVLRGVHDAIAHFMGQHPFSARGEYAAYTRHLKTLCNVDQAKSGRCPAAQILFTEIVGQTSYYYVYGSYTEQKAAIMYDFDHWNVGSLSPQSPLNKYFQVAGKALVPTENFNYQDFSQSFPSLANEMKKQLSAKSIAPLQSLPGEQ
jgi:hypothetical protein